MTTIALERPQPSHVTVATASLIGTAIEWYDFFLYGTAAALIFNKLFFPTFDPMMGTLLAFRCGPNAWHGHHPFVGQRRTLQLNWVTDRGVVRREELRHRVSALAKRLFGGG